ncbi:MAG: 3'-5' exonuclease [Betaproteobacteria bacterium]|nr:3'-5' exonuclease [Betaproteobacteria bacterium]
MSDAVIVIDFETTGISPAHGARATEVAAVLVADGRILDRYQSLMNTGAWIPPFIEQLTGISNRMIQQAPDAARVMGELARFIGDTPLVAHNASFDKKFLQAELDRIQLAPQAEMLCSMRVARRVYPQAVNHKLATLVRHARLVKTGAYHRALADAEMTAGLWLEMQAELGRQFGLERIPLALLRKIQSAPCRGLRGCVEAFRRSSNFQIQ